MPLLQEIGFDCRELQIELQERGFDPGPADDKCGTRTIEALRKFQAASGLLVDGIPGPKTLAKLGLVIPGRDLDLDPSMLPDTTLRQQSWPRQRDVESFYGPAGNPKCTAGVVELPIAMRVLNDDGKTIRMTKTFNCHVLCEKHFEWVFLMAVKEYGEDTFRKLDLDVYSGCFNNRPMRGGRRKSMHAYGCALDLNAQKNMLKQTHKTAQFARSEYVPFWNIVEASGAISLGRVRDFDWMHFQYARL